jgi:hypothetical protein
MSGSPSITEWISAISTAGLGLLGAVFGAWQWMMSKFRPKLSARIDASKDAVELVIVNKGRASGIISQVDIQRPDGSLVEDVDFEGLPGQRFVPMSLPAMASTRLILMAPEGTVFPPDCNLIVDVGKKQPDELTPKQEETSMGIVGLRSVLPPGALPDRYAG